MPSQPPGFQPLKSPSEMAGATPTVGELFRARARIQRSLPAIEYQGREISYGELLDRVERLTGALAARGLVRGDRIALLSATGRNIWRWNWRRQISASSPRA